MTDPSDVVLVPRVMDAEAFNAFTALIPWGSPERQLAIDVWLGVLNYARSGKPPVPVRFEAAPAAPTPAELVEEIAAFLKVRDESVLPEETSDQERLESADAILAAPAIRAALSRPANQEGGDAPSPAKALSPAAYSDAPPVDREGLAALSHGSAGDRGLREAAQRVLDGLNARIDAALGGSVPVFDGIADLHTALAQLAERQEGEPMKMQVSPEWLRDKIASDPDLNTEACTPQARAADGLDERGLAGAVIDELWPILGGNHVAAETWNEISQAVEAALLRSRAPVAQGVE